MNRSAIAMLARVTSLFLLINICNSSALAQVNACQKQCTSKNGPCSINSDKYDMCVSKCQLNCTECGTGLDQTQPQLALSLETNAACPADATLTQIGDTLKQTLKQQLGLKNPDVHKPSCQSGLVSVLMWTTPPANQCTTEARTSAQMPAIIANTTFGFFIASSTLPGLAQSAFASKPALHGVPGFPSIHLTSLSLDFLDPTMAGFTKWWCKASVCENLSSTNGMITQVKGYDDRTTPSIDFTDVIVDVLQARTSCTPVTDPSCGCLTDSTTNIPPPQELIVAVTGFVSAALSTVLQIGPLIDVWTGDIDAASYQPSGGSQGGAACSVYQSLPDEIALPETGGQPGSTVLSGPPVQKNKLVITYLEPKICTAPVPGICTPQEVLDPGIGFLGTVALKPRTPAVQIQGPAELTVNRHSFTTSATYSVFPVPLQAQDFFGTRGYIWTAGPAHAQIASGNQQQTQIQFSTDPNLQPGQSAVETVQVEVVDSEATSATATLSVRIVKLATDQPPPGPTPPPRCKQNPNGKDCPPTHPF